MSQAIKDYFEALERLKSGAPTRVRADTLISNDAVALEAGRKPGSIKKSRDVFADLIVAIDQAAEKQTQKQRKQKAATDMAKLSAADYRRQLEQALGRELSLVRELFRLKQELASLKGGNVVPLRPAAVGTRTPM
jgi:hypothetical protein